MATCLAETILATASLSGFTELSERAKLDVMLQSIYQASGSSDTVDQLIEAAKTAGFSKIADERYKACILLQLMVSLNSTTTSASDILAASAASQFMFLNEGAKKSAFLQLMCDINDGDADAAAYIARAGITDATEQAALEALVVELKAGDLWDGGVGLYPILGGTQAKFAYNLASTSYDITWVGTLDVSALGAASDGSSYGRTGITKADTGTSFSLAAYQTEAVVGPSFPQHISAYLNPTNSPRELGHTTLATATVRVSASPDALAQTFPGGDNSGLFTLTCNPAQFRVFRRATEFLGSPQAVTNSLALDPTSEYGLMCRWNNSTANLFNTGHIGFFALYAEDISSKIGAFNTAMENYQTALSRNA